MSASPIWGFKTVQKPHPRDPADLHRNRSDRCFGAPVPRLVWCDVSLQKTLIRARTCVQRGQVNAAIKLYRGLLVTFAQHPQVNADLGLLLLQHRTAQEAIPLYEQGCGRNAVGF